MHLFVLLLKKRSNILMGLSIIFLINYVNFVTPDISRPLTIIGFFSVVFLTGVSALYVILGGFKEKSRRLLWASTVSLCIVYIVALGSLKLLAVSHVLMATVVTTIILFVIEKSYTR